MCPELYCDWSESNQSVHGFFTFTLIFTWFDNCVRTAASVFLPLVNVIHP